MGKVLYIMTLSRGDVHGTFPDLDPKDSWGHKNLTLQGKVIKSKINTDLAKVIHSEKCLDHS